MGMHDAALGKAAVQVLAVKGARGFTHRAVDQCAGLPEGTASRYARSREALFELAINTLFIEEWEAAANATKYKIRTISTAAEFVDACVNGTLALLEAPEKYRARRELQLEATRSPALRRLFRPARAAFVAEMAEGIKGLGVTDAYAHADVLMAVIDGVLHRQLVLDEPPLSRQQLTALYQAYVSSIVPATSSGDTTISAHDLQ